MAIATAVKSVTPAADIRSSAPIPGWEQGRTEPRGFTRRAVLNVLEAFFSRPIVSLLPLILLAGLGMYKAASTTEEFRSVGMLNTTSGSLLDDLTQSGAQPAGYETQAVVTSRNINDLLGTELFLDEVIDAARLRSAVESGQITRDEIRASLGASPRGDNLVSVWATTPRAEQSQLLAKAVIDRFLEYVVDSDLEELNVRVEWYTEQLARYDADVADATQAYEQYNTEHQLADEEDRPFDQRLAIERLEGNLSRATTLRQETQTLLDEAELAASVARTGVAAQLRVVDDPNVPAAPLPRMKQAAMTFLLFGVLGGILTLCFIVLRAFLDRTVRVPEDITAKFGTDVIAVVPPGRRR